jgi:hypothetical protein
MQTSSLLQRADRLCLKNYQKSAAPIQCPKCDDPLMEIDCPVSKLEPPKPLTSMSAKRAPSLWNALRESWSEVKRLSEQQPPLPVKEKEIAEQELVLRTEKLDVSYDSSRKDNVSMAKEKLRENLFVLLTPAEFEALEITNTQKMLEDSRYYPNHKIQWLIADNGFYVKLRPV